MKYFVINKQLEYDRCFLSGLEARDGVLKLSSQSRRGGYMFSRIYDSTEPQMQWHRFIVDGDFRDAGIAVRIYASEQLTVLVDGKYYLISEIMEDTQMPITKKLQILEPYKVLEAAGRRNILLHDVTGRYLFFMLELFRQEDDPKITSICITFPRESWLKYLPAVYSRQDKPAAYEGDQAMDGIRPSSFTERYLALFQSLYEELEWDIKDSARLMNPAAVDRNLLITLASWFDVKDVYLWPDDKLRDLIPRLPELMKLKGTALGLREYVKLYTGEEPDLAEDGEKITLTVKERYIKAAKDYQALVRIADSMKPADVQLRIISKDAGVSLGSGLRLGINSTLVQQDEDPAYPERRDR
jgi:phage tail-like protein